MIRYFIMILLLIHSTLNFAEIQVPDVLKPWQPWVLHGTENEQCPFFHQNVELKRCAWPSQLILDMTENQAVFKQSWTVYQDAWVDLPGDARLWPEHVEIDDEAGIIRNHQGKPQVRLVAGFHRIQGEFNWQRAPEYIAVPLETGLLKIQKQGMPVVVERDDKGRIWLSRGEQSQHQNKQKKLIQLTVFRVIKDDMPLTMDVYLKLKVAGENREMLLGALFSDQFLPMKLDSQLPARLESNNQLRLQIRPGQWDIHVKVRYQGAVNQLAFKRPDQAVWPQQEVWVFKPRHDLRMVTITGADKIDPNQTRLPQQFKQYPTYLMNPGDQLTLVEKRRGDANPSPDQLSLQRNIYLDFKGTGYTIVDHINGTMNRGWRLEMKMPALLGRVALDNENQFITRLNNKANPGVEVRHGQVNLMADSRIDQFMTELSAVGWDHDFNKVTANLYLPPGWQLMHATGIDQLSNSWIQKWSLLDLFIVLMVSLSIAKLWRWQWGLVALVTLVLTYHATSAPQFMWLNLIAAIALLRLLPAGKFCNWVNRYRLISTLVLVVTCLVFMVNEARQAIYLQLEKPWLSLDESNSKSKRYFSGDRHRQSQTDKYSKMERYSSNAAPVMMQQQVTMKKRSALKQIDVNAQVQTGPGIPQWSWNSVRLAWNGPVEKNQKMHLYLIAPPLSRLLHVFNVGVVVLLLFRLLNVGDWFNKRNRMTGQAVAMVLVLIFVGSLHAVPTVSASTVPFEPTLSEVPSESLLTELKKRLLAPAVCVPDCFDFSHMTVTLENAQLTLNLSIDSTAKGAFPLPKIQNLRYSEKVSFDQQTQIPALYMDKQDTLWVVLNEGRHQINMTYVLTDSTQLTMIMPVKPHKLSVSALDWDIQGMDDNGYVKHSLQLIKQVKSLPEQSKPTTLKNNSHQFAPFFRVTRRLILGLDWEIETTVERQYARDKAVVIKIPTLSGESVTSPHVRLEDQQIVVNFSTLQKSVLYRSVLEKQDKIQLAAAKTNAWIERWELDIGYLWHVIISGIPPVHQQSSTGQWLPTYKPWPGESLTLNIAKPEGIAGPTMTIDKSQLTIKPGNRVTDYTLMLNLRSSRGGQHTIILPESASLLATKINTKTIPVEQDGKKVTLPITPGSQQIELSWRQSKSVSTYLMAPAVNIGISSVNAKVHMDIPADRWILFAGGPGIGPAILFWGVIGVLIVVAAGLARIPWVPLKMHHWVLLGLGIASAAMNVIVVVVGWFFIMGWRYKIDIYTLKKWQFNLLQIGLVALTLVALSSLLFSIEQGLLGKPDMSIVGNGSSIYHLYWYQDRIAESLSQPWVVTIPLFWYRVLMLFWSLWLAFAMLNWLKWAWQCFSQGGLWRKIDKMKVNLNLKKSSSTEVV